MATLLQPRRRFLFALIAGLAALAGMEKFLKTRPLQRKVLVDTPVAGIPTDGALVFTDERVAVVRDKDGFYALSLVCTHLGCTVSVTPDGLFCPCHGSRFDNKGNVTRGPASRPLPRLALEVRGDRLIVNI